MLTILLLTSCAIRSYGEIMEANWDLSLPGGYRQVYETDTGPSPHGDGIRYHVFSYPADTEGFPLWSADPAKYAPIAQGYLDTLAVPEAERTEFSQCACYFQQRDDNSRLYLFWEEGSGKLYIVEWFQ